MQLRFTRSIRPLHIIAVALLLALVMVVSAVIELGQSRDELFHLMRDEALSLVETVDRSSANIILSTETIEESLAERLFNNAYFIARLDSAGTVTQHELQAIASANSIFRINILDSRGRRVLGSMLQQPEHRGMQEQRSPLETLKPVLDGSVDRLVIGLREPRYQEGARFVVAVRRTGKARGAIVLNLNADAMLDLRRTIGIGKLMKDLGDNEGIVYAVLQDGEGILAAGGEISEVSSVEADTVLRYSAEHDTVLTRTIAGTHGELFEVVRHFKVGETTLGIFRIGMSMDEVRAAEARMQRRMIIMVLVLLAIAFLVVSAVVAMQRSALLAEKNSLLEKEMYRREKLSAMGELASGVAHEIRNPLNAIAMIAQRLEHEFTPRKGAKEYRMIAGVLKSEAGRMNGIVQQFLRFARPPGLRTAETDVRGFIDHLSMLFGPQAAGKGVTFTPVHDGPDQWTFDAAQMTQAVLNLLQNALDATEPGGSITLAGAGTASTLSISVADTGCGIPDGEREKIFNLYFSTKQNGTGLGLALVHQIVAQHSGTIDVKSSLGKGTIITIDLPSVPPPHTVQVAAQPLTTS